MARDLSEELRDAAGPLPELDDATFSRLNRPRRRSGRAALAMIAAVLLAGAAGWLATSAGGSTVELAPGEGGAPQAPRTEPVESALPAPSTPGEATDRKPGDDPTEDGPSEAADTVEDATPSEAADPVAVAERLGAFAWEVLTVDSTPGYSVAGRIASNQAELERLWQRFDAGRPAPALPQGHGAIILPMAGDCDDAAQVHGVGPIVDADRTSVLAAVQIDAGCARLLTQGTVWEPPYTLYAIAIPLEVADQLAGAVGVVGNVSDYGWEVLAVAAKSPAPKFKVASASEQTKLEDLWHILEAQGPAPTLPAGEAALLAAVPGNCGSPEQVRNVDVVVDTQSNPQVPEVLARILIDASCAERLASGVPRTQPMTLFAITVPAGVAESLGAIGVLIDCTSKAPSEEEPCAGSNQDPIDPYAAHPAAVAACLRVDDPEVLGIAPASGPQRSGEIVNDQAGLNRLWRELAMGGPAPELRPDHGALSVFLTGPCDNPSDVRFIDAIPNADQTKVQAVVWFGETCAAHADATTAQPQTVYVLGVPLDAAEQLDEAWATVLEGEPTVSGTTRTNRGLQQS